TLYLNSLATTRVPPWDAVAEHITVDITATAGAPSIVVLRTLAEAAQLPLWQSRGQCLDSLDLLEPADAEEPITGAQWLKHAVSGEQVEEVWFSHLLCSLCSLGGQHSCMTV